MRVSVFVDGFNLYHAIKRLKQEHLKWLDLSLLSRRLVRPRSDVITAIYYFSAYAYWRPDSMKRHEAYVAALVTRGVTPVLGKFKAKQHPYRCCYGCQHYQPSHEEKESDVNLALYLLNEAYKDTYDKALVISRDSDQVPAFRLVRTLFPDKRIVVVAPPHRGHSSELLQVASGRLKIKLNQVAESLLPALVPSPAGWVIRRPAEYDPREPL